MSPTTKVSARKKEAEREDKDPIGREEEEIIERDEEKSSQREDKSRRE